MFKEESKAMTKGLGELVEEIKGLLEDVPPTTYSPFAFFVMSCIIVSPDEPPRIKGKTNC